MKKLLTNWSLMRVLRLMMGIFILVDGIRSAEVFFIFLGVLFVLLPFIQPNCCVGHSCATKQIKDSSEEITFTEIK